LGKIEKGLISTYSTGVYYRFLLLFES